MTDVSDRRKTFNATAVEIARAVAEEFQRVKLVPPAGKQTKKFITFQQLQTRWGDCSHMFIERRMREDPTFPPHYQMGPGATRLFALNDIEKYERSCVVKRGGKAA